MFRPTPAATSRVRSPSKPRSAIWLKAAWTSPCSRSSLRDRTGRVAGLIRISIKHLMESIASPGVERRACHFRCYARDHKEVANVQSIARGDDPSGTGSRAGESLLPRQARVDANARESGRRPLYADGGHGFWA